MTACSICKKQIFSTDVAVYNCGCKYHLSCTLALSMQNKAACPKCKQLKIQTLIDLGNDYEHRLRTKHTPHVTDMKIHDSVEEMTGGNTMFDKFKTIMTGGTKTYIENEKNFEVFQKKYDVRALITNQVDINKLIETHGVEKMVNFGVDWGVFLQLGLKNILSFSSRDLQLLGVKREQLLAFGVDKNIIDSFDLSDSSNAKAEETPSKPYSIPKNGRFVF